MRKVLKHRFPVLAAAAFCFAATACDAPESPDEDAAEAATLSDGSDELTGEEIEQAVPGIEDADPEGDTPNTADLDEDENLEVSEIDDPDDRPD